MRAASLSAATGGRLERSLRQHELRQPHGLGDELRVALATDGGTWGAIVLMREEGRAHFAAADTERVASLSGCLAEGLRRGILHGALPTDDQELGSGLLLLAEDNAIELANPAAQSWLAELEGGATPAERLPFVIEAVADQARNNALGAPTGNANANASARVRTRSGRWLLVRGSMLGDGPEARAAVIIEPARSSELAPLIADAYNLTPRERAVTQLVAQGLTTREISRRLFLSSYTVQDHLKSIFEKTGVGSRGALVGRLFFEHYAPRLASGERIGSDGWFAPTRQNTS